MKLYFNKALNKLFASVPGEGNWELPNANQLEGLSSGGLTPVEVTVTGTSMTVGGSPIATFVSGNHYLVDMSGAHTGNPSIGLEQGAEESMIAITVFGIVDQVSYSTTPFYLDVDADGAETFEMAGGTYDDLELGSNAGTIMCLWDSDYKWIVDTHDLYTPNTWGGNLTVTGSLSLSGIHDIGDADYEILDNDGSVTVVASSISTTRTITLPIAANNDGRIITIKNLDATPNQLVVVDNTDAALIDGDASIKLYKQYESITVQSNGSTWLLINANWAQGVYTPSATNVSGLGTVTAHEARYMRVKDMVHVSGTCNVDASPTNGQVVWRFNPPIDSVFTNAYQAAGSIGGASTNGNTFYQWIDSVVATADIKFQWYANTGNLVCYYIYSYKLI